MNTTLTADPVQEFRRAVAYLLDRASIDVLTAAVGMELRERATVLRELGDWRFAAVYETAADAIERTGDIISIEGRI